MNDITKRVISGMSGDGFNERKGYINRNNDLNRLKSGANFDQSLAKMKMDENKPDIKTVDNITSNSTLTNNDTSILKRNINNYQNQMRNLNNFK